jgi:hypothetical protein
MRDHPVPGAQRVLHRPPRVVARRWLDIPHVSGIAVQLTGLDGRCDGIFVADRATGSVDEPGAFLEMREEVGVDETDGAFVQRTVDGDDVTL